jgi:hypothetical protein
MKRLSLILLAFGAPVSGCATTPVARGLARPVAADRLLAFNETPATPFGTLVVTRDKGFAGAACYVGLTIDGVFSACLDTAETAVFRVPAGDVLLRTEFDLRGKGPCRRENHGPATQRESSIRAGEIKRFRISIEATGTTDIRRAD